MIKNPIIKLLNDSYEPPWTLEKIKDEYGEKTYRRLAKDPVHSWRAKTGIELIHKEPTKEEFERIVKNWNLMSDRQKQISDKKSIELFGDTNLNRVDDIRKEYDDLNQVKSEHNLQKITFAKLRKFLFESIFKAGE